jgi:hypothetical protein
MTNMTIPWTDPFAALIILVFVVLGCAEQPRWKVQRQIVDSNGSPLAGVQVEVTALQDPHELSVQLGGATKATSHMVTDAKGMFSVEKKCRALGIELSKQGYISKKFMFYSGTVEPGALAPTGIIQLQNNTRIVEADNLDKRGDKELLVHFPPGQTNLGVSLLDGEIVAASSTNAVLVFQLKTNTLNIKCSNNTELRSTDWETGLTVESWKQNHQVMPSTPPQRSLTFKCDSDPGNANVAGAFFVRVSDGQNGHYCARIYFSCVTTQEYNLWFSLSEDDFFVAK